ncbi:hypothetical protein BJ980_002034 [Nocardioides daedukensis]|uniref:DUF222 domain-containing protein n=1 Tax=Nocardioides daedukensis TaxID=634462 RepID=A0A7Y9UR00_9ACTN|nr:DUF222 domain-containing protein [Nocardioides daedukensis]NYG59111.1 hypothetical protein [Nocardioides daedukensis]
MTEFPIDSGRSVFVSGVANMHGLLDSLADAQPTFASTDAKAGLLVDLVRAESRVAALKLRVLAGADDVAERDGARNAGAWLAAYTNTDARAAHGQLRLAQALESRWTRTAAALAAGSLTLAQTEAIVDALAEVDDELDREQLQVAEELMITHAADLDPARLRAMGRHLADVVDPASAQEREAQRLADQERRARERARLSLRPMGDGTTRLSGILPDAVAHRLEKNLDAFAQPRKQAADADGLRAPRHRLLALALGDLLERIDPDRLPHHGGDATTVIVTLTLEQLLGTLGAAGLGFDDSTPITAADARRLACQANLIPASWVAPGRCSTPADRPGCIPRWPAR